MNITEFAILCTKWHLSYYGQFIMNNAILNCQLVSTWSSKISNFFNLGFFRVPAVSTHGVMNVLPEYNTLMLLLTDPTEYFVPRCEAQKQCTIGSHHSTVNYDMILHRWQQLQKQNTFKSQQTAIYHPQVDTVETLYNTINFCWNTHKRHSIARPKGRGLGCLLWVQRATYCVDLSILSSIKYLL